MYDMGWLCGEGYKGFRRDIMEWKEELKGGLLEQYNYEHPDELHRRNVYPVLELELIADEEEVELELERDM
jgi:hypothetical protein